MPETSYLHQILILLAAAVIAVPVFQRLGMGTVLGYLIAGAIIGPWGLEFIHEVEDIRHIAEFGVIFLLFLIGIELKPSRLWTMRRMVFGLGSTQIRIIGQVLSESPLLQNAWFIIDHHIRLFMLEHMIVNTVKDCSGQVLPSLFQKRWKPAFNLAT